MKPNILFLMTDQMRGDCVGDRRTSRRQNAVSRLSRLNRTVFPECLYRLPLVHCGARLADDGTFAGTYRTRRL